LPINYAVSRSVFFVDVRFEGKFERGFFRFYSFKKKKDLYIYGKKTQNYECVKPDFIGRFTNGYVVDEKQYRAAKMKDMIDSEKEVVKPTELQIKAKILRQIREKLPQLTPQLLAEIFHVNDRTCRTWLNDDKIFDGNPNNSESVGRMEYNNNINQDENNLGEEAE
jgi:DNA-binding transcriptional regulator YiaG